MSAELLSYERSSTRQIPRGQLEAIWAEEKHTLNHLRASAQSLPNELPMARLSAVPRIAPHHTAIPSSGMPLSASPHLPQPNTAETVAQEPTEPSSRSRLSPSYQRNPRRSNSAMSNPRARTLAGKEETDVELRGLGEGREEATVTAEPQEGDDGEDLAGSGDSSQSTATTANTRSRRKGAAKKKKTTAARARGSKEVSMTAEEGREREEDGEKEETTIKSEVDNDEAEMGAEEGTDMSRSNSKDNGKSSHQRSTSGFKELAGLGLKSLGDGEEEPLVPRRTRRGAASPIEGVSSRKEEEGEQVEESVGQDGEAEGTVDRPSGADESINQPERAAAVGDEETAEEGVTRCLCGSADENVGLMIQCETCKCWQHCICMGMRTEDDCPDVYFCEQCRPELHVPLLRLLGVLPASRNIKRSGGQKTYSGRVSAKDAAKELKEAKEAVLTLAKENERRRKEGREPVTGWSVAQEQEHLQLQLQLQQQLGSGRAPSSGQHKGQPSETQMRSSRSQSREEMTAPKSPPKRRSTMNSRDSAYGWESIPPGLLNDSEDWITREDSEGIMRKRKRGTQTDEGEPGSPSPPPGQSADSISKRRRTSSGVDFGEDGRPEGTLDEEEEGANNTVTATASAEVTAIAQPTKKASKSRAARDSDSSRPKHPNQYTARRAAAAAAAAAAAGGVGGGSSSSPSPSPNKHRLADGSRRTTSLRDMAQNGSRMATPTPNGNQGDYARATNPGAPWGMPEHLSHLAFLLPSSTGPEPLKVSVASTKGMPSTSNSKTGSTSTAIKDSKTDRITQASPQPFQLISLSEPNTKIRFPGKRTTMGEMRKRVRNILDFVSRLQIESAERERRLKFLGISKQVSSTTDEANETLTEGKATADEVVGEERPVIGATEETAHSNDSAGQATVNDPGAEASHEAQDGGEDTEMMPASADSGQGEQIEQGNQGDEGKQDGQDAESSKEAPVVPPAATSSVGPISPSIAGEGGEGATAAATTESTSTAASALTLQRFTELHSSSMSLVDELTRELLSFQQRYGTGANASTLMAPSSSAY